jgi:hypothetical protein
MRRRDLVILLGGAAAWPLAARAQQPGKLPTMGIIGSGTPATQGHWYAAFVQRLRELGWIDGRTVAVEYRWAEGRDERFAEIAAEFVQRKVDVIVTSSTVGVVAAKQATVRNEGDKLRSRTHKKTGMRPRAQHIGQQIGKRLWLDKLQNVSPSGGFTSCRREVLRPRQPGVAASHVNLKFAA